MKTPLVVPMSTTYTPPFVQKVTGTPSKIMRATFSPMWTAPHWHVSPIWARSGRDDMSTQGKWSCSRTATKQVELSSRFLKSCSRRRRPGNIPVSPKVLITFIATYARPYQAYHSCLDGHSSTSISSRSSSASRSTVTS